MARKASGTARRQAGTAALPTTVKLTVRISLQTAQRLGVESSMRRVSQSEIVESVLSAYLARWRLPSTVHDQAEQAGDGAGRAESAA